MADEETSDGEGALKSTESIGIDWDVARKLIPGGDAGIHNLAEVFRKECVELMTEVEKGLADGDAKRVMRGAHTLKSAARYFGAQPVVDAASIVEQLGSENRLSEAVASISELRRCVDLFRKALEDLPSS